MMVSRISILLVLVLASCGLCAQNSDCATAIPVCSSSYTQNNSPAGTGQVFEVAPGTCQTGGEFNSAWYVFTVQQAGYINFVLTPNNQNDDYDWSVYNITNNGCGGINNGTSPEVSCNSFGQNFGVQGPTGISSSQGGTGNSNGPGNLNGPAFNANLNVQVGQVFALAVMNYSATLNGYNLNFAGSTATIFDNTSPVITTISQNCSGNQLLLTFSEPVLTNALNTLPISVIVGGQTIVASSVQASSTSFSTQLTVNFANPLPAGTVQIVPTANTTLTDFCGNAWSDPFNYTIAPALIITGVTTTSACNGTGGSAQIIVQGGITPLVYALAGQNQDNGNYSNLNAGNYNALVTDATGCTATQNVTIDNIAPTVTAGPDQVLCDMQTTLVANAQAGNVLWQPLAGLTFTQPGQVATQVSATEPGIYILQVVVDIGGCLGNDEVQVEFNFPPGINLDYSNASCFGVCDGELTLSGQNNQSLTVTFNGGTSTGDLINIASICAGQYTLVVNFGQGCIASYPIEISQPAKVEARFEALNWVVPVTDPMVQLTGLSSHSDSIYWSVVGWEELYSSNQVDWSFELPQESGTYEIALLVFDSNGCSDRATARITVRDELYFYLPNSFTPNDDGINDVIKPLFSYEPQWFEWTIFNRWGDAIFSTNDVFEPWLGEVKDGEYFSPNGLYHWVMKYRGTDIDVKQERGFIVLLR